MSDAARMQARIDYLKRVRPKDPEIARLQKRMGSAGGTPSTGGPATIESVESFLGRMLDQLGPMDLSGAPRLLNEGDITRTRQEAQDALFNENTQFLERNRQRDLAEVKQELANRGIPFNPTATFDPNTKDLYGRTIGAVNEGFRADQQRALDQARIGADQRISTLVDTNRKQYDQFVDRATREMESKLSSTGAGTSILNQLMQKYGIDKSAAESALTRASNERIARQRAAGSGGGGGGGGGFEIIA